MEYSFNIGHARGYGLEEAIMIQSFVFWIMKNKANGKHLVEGRTWTYNSIEAFATLFPFWSKRQIERILRSLVDKKVLIRDNFNQYKYDRTCWYAFADESLFIEPDKSLISTISPNSEMHITVSENAFPQTVKPIPVTTNNITTNKDNNINNTNTIYSKPERKKRNWDKYSQRELELEHIKSYSIVDYLEAHGFQPEKTTSNGKGRIFWFLSPLRDEREPSFAVYEKNKGDLWDWFDFGINEGGSIVDLVMKLQGYDYAAAMQHLRELVYSYSDTS
ncbi:MAG: hypothetical protein HQL08_08680 [Nitrospirae bacterium]|nr:hypothetical protein [Nitrospirota bacterium]